MSRPRKARPEREGDRGRNSRSSGTEHAAKTDRELVQAVTSRGEAPSGNFLTACVSISLSIRHIDREIDR